MMQTTTTLAGTRQPISRTASQSGNLTLRFALMLATFMLTIGVTSCSQFSARSTNDDTQSFEKYFPLEVGNEWSYQSTDGNEVRLEQVSVTGVKKLGRDEYFEVVRTTSGSSTRDVSYLRWNYDGRLLRWVGGVEDTYIDFSSLRDPASKLERLAGNVVAKDERVSVTAGAFDECVKVQFPKVESAAYHYAPGVGLVGVGASADRTAWSLSLRSARVGGVSYPG